MTASCSSKQVGMVRRPRIYPLLLSSLACVLTPGLTEAGAYIFAGDMWGYDLILHPADYNGSGGTLTVKVCITPGSPHAAAMEIPVQNNINIYNALQPTTNNIFLNSNNNIPSGSLDFESVALHEVGHCLGMAHVNAASESGLTGSDQDYTKSTDGGDGFDLGIGADNIKGSGDDFRGNDVNLHWFHKVSNNPFTIGTTVDSTTYSRNLVDLPGPDIYATNGSRAVSSSLGAPNTEVVMQQGTFFDEAQRTLTHDDIATLRLAASGMDESAGNGDDYTINMEYGGISASPTCDINIAFDNAQTGLAQCNVSGGPIMGTDHWRVVSADIYFNDFNYTWHFNTTTVNQAPVLATIGNQNVAEGQSLPVAVSATDADGDNLAFSAAGLPALASLVDHGNGTATLNINPAAGDVGIYNVTVNVDDDGLPVLTDTEPFQIDVTAPSVDTDGDGIDDATELANGTDPNLVDSDGDGLTDGATGFVLLGLVPGGIDKDGDGFADGELDYGTDPNLVDTDGDQISDTLEADLGSNPLSAGSWPAIADGDLAPLGSPDGNINAADLLIAERILQGSITPLPLQFAHGDLYPPGSPDGVIDLSDVILLLNLVLNQP